jgi:hypothetical protein
LDSKCKDEPAKFSKRKKRNLVTVFGSTVKFLAFANAKMPVFKLLIFSHSLFVRSGEALAQLKK